MSAAGAASSYERREVQQTVLSAENSCDRHGCREQSFLSGFGAANSLGMISSNIVDVSKIPNEFLLMLGNLADWKVNGELPEDIVTYSLSNNVGIDDYFVVMLASNKSRTVQKKSRWSDEYVHKLSPLFNRTVIGNGRKHHGSVGKYLGMVTTAKYA